ncbi:MAG: AarF/ABC1/UbiB kinase family protein [Actinomycetota bacterium]|nr:AarF/ABC1/UbiB kinase family protein [Actinomycetota bacterium]
MTRPRRADTTRAVAAGLALVAAGGAALAVARRRRVPGAPVRGASVSTRYGRLAASGARSGGRYAALRARRVFASAERRGELEAEFQLRTAEEVVETLGNMKGALMKLGQMASYLDQGMPPHLRDALAQLQADAPPMSAELAAGVIEAELGRPPEVLFERWDPVPIAAASIGQVHRAITRDQRAVAVKVQYPGVDRAIAADLGSARAVFGGLGMMFGGLEPGPVVEELRARITEELDYRLEAANQRLFGRFFAGHPTIHVPAVVDELSTARVLTTELAEGVRLEEAARWPQHERDLAAETIYRFAFGSLYRLRAFNGDPHPGNYLFRPGGHVTFLDFGLVKRFTPDELAVYGDMISAMVLDHDPTRFRRIIEGVGLLREGVEASDEHVADYFRHFYSYVLTDDVREIDEDYSAATVRQIFDPTGPHAAVKQAANVPPSFVVIQRINLGLIAVFGALRARNPWRHLAEELWPFVDAPPRTEMGRRIAEVWNQDEAWSRVAGDDA